MVIWTKLLPLCHGFTIGRKSEPMTMNRSRTVARKFSVGGLCVLAEGLWVFAGGLDTLKISTDL